MHDKAIIEFGFHMISNFIKPHSIKQNLDQKRDRQLWENSTELSEN